MEGLSNLFRGNGYTTINGAQVKNILNDSNIVILDVEIQENIEMDIFQRQ